MEDARRPAGVPYLQKLLAWSVPIVLVTIAAAIRLPTLMQPLLERHEFRQTQTAFTARIFHTDGIDLFHPQLPVLGPPWEVPFEFPLFQAGAAVLMDLGVEETVALRGFSLVWFVVSALLLYALLRPRIGMAAAAAALAVFLVSPFGIQWSRTSMIEYLALAAALGFAVVALVWRERGGGRWWMLAVILGSVAALVKITTVVFWVLPFALLGYSRQPVPRGAWRSIPAWGLVAIPLAIGAAWTHHADAIKAASDATAFLTSASVVDWNLGTVEQRFDAEAWASALGPSVLLTTSLLLPASAIAMVLHARRNDQGRFWAWLAITYVTPIVVFFNLYVEHDYYTIAVTPAVAAIVGAAAAWLLQSRRPAARVVLVAGVVIFVAGVFGNIRYLGPMYGFPPTQRTLPRLASQVAEETRADQPVAALGRDWNPALLYLANRRGMMVRDATWPPGLVERLLADGWAVYHCPRRGEGAGTCMRISVASN